jgi:hypothetical protein
MHKTDQTGKGFPSIAAREALDNDTDGIMSPKQVIKNKDI